MKLCDCEGGLCSWNSYFQKWKCDECGAWRTEEEQKIVDNYLKLKYDENIRNLT